MRRGRGREGLQTEAPALSRSKASVPTHSDRKAKATQETHSLGSQQQTLCNGFSSKSSVIVSEFQSTLKSPYERGAGFGLIKVSVIYFFVNLWEDFTSKSDLESYLQSLTFIGFSGEVHIAYSLEAVSPSRLKKAIEQKCPSCLQVRPPLTPPFMGPGLICISVSSQEIPFHSNVVSFYGLPFIYLK